MARSCSSMPGKVPNVARLPKAAPKVPKAGLPSVQKGVPGDNLGGKVKNSAGVSGTGPIKNTLSGGRAPSFGKHAWGNPNDHFGGPMKGHKG